MGKDQITQKYVGATTSSHAKKASQLEIVTPAMPPSRNKRAKTCAEKHKTGGPVKESTNVANNQPGPHYCAIGEQEQSNNFPSFSDLPSVALKEILKNVANLRVDHYHDNQGFAKIVTDDYDEENYQMKQILKCRLVCRQWNEIVEDTSEFMAKVAFPIHDIEEFLNLPIVKKGKVRSIILHYVVGLPCYYINEFMEAIRKVEKVSFRFLYRNTLLFKHVLENCSNLQELKLKNVRGLDTEIIKNLSSATIPKIKVISFENSTKLDKVESSGIINFIFNLPELREIRFDGMGVSESTPIIVARLTEYIKTYEKSLRLKKIFFGDLFTPQSCTADNVKIHIENIAVGFMIFCGKYGILFDGQPSINFNKLLELESSNLSSFQHRPLFPVTVHGKLTFEGPALTNLDRFNSLNIGQLYLKFHRVVTIEELTWINSLKSLESLNLVNNKPRNRYLVPNTISGLVAVLSAGLPTVKEFTMFKIYNPILVHGLSQYFPNLETLIIEGARNSPNEIIEELTAIESLRTLCFFDLRNLQDAAFTRKCVNKFATKDSSCAHCTMAPAIACFKLLQNLVLDGCKRLTNDCFINGISKCKTLCELQIDNCGITEDLTELAGLVSNTCTDESSS